MGIRSRVVMTTHDAIYVESPDKEAEQACQWMKKMMEEAIQMPIVPLEIDVEVLPPRGTPMTAQQSRQ